MLLSENGEPRTDYPFFQLCNLDLGTDNCSKSRGWLELKEEKTAITRRKNINLFEPTQFAILMCS